MKLKLAITALFLYAGLTAGAQTVILDYYFNHEVHQDAAGKQVRFHYLWNEKGNTGFSILGASFTIAGARLDSLDQAPTANNLKNAAIYIIVDPDSKKESPSPNYIQPKDADEIAKWVKKGGVLLMMANDSANVELPHFNLLAAKFGMHFNNDLQNHVIDDAHFEDGAIKTTGNPVFKTANKIFMKDVCSIGLSGGATSVLNNSAGACIIASAKYGKGTVVAIGDPWLYNEYTNGRLPAGFENDKAANDMVQWLLQLAASK
jgi:predicted 3-demethylubiquinone-9 3-methyltransferase (glyoxalase superfamily)